MIELQESHAVGEIIGREVWSLGRDLIVACAQVLANPSQIARCVERKGIAALNDFGMAYEVVFCGCSEAVSENAAKPFGTFGPPSRSVSLSPSPRIS